MARVHKQGRRELIDDLRAALSTALAPTGTSRGAAKAPAPTTLILTAGPGAGKSHTLAQLRSEVNVRTTWTAAHELSWRQPFAVAAALVGADLPAVIPDGYGDSLYDRVDAMCADGPLALFLDDAHHADAESLTLLTRLSAAARDLPLVVVVGRRPLPERELLTRLAARPTAREWSLPAMSGNEIAAVCREVVGAEPDRALLGALAAAHGNPMHAISLLRTLDQSGDLIITDGRATLGAGASARVSTGDRDAVAEHLALLDSRARDLTQKLAVWGGPATLVDLAAIDHAAPASLIGAAQSATDAGIITADEDGTLSFTHDLYADVTYQQLAPAFRTILHDAIADLPQTRGDHQRETHHRLASGTDPNAITDAVRRARDDLTHSPAVVVDLLDPLARQGDTATGVHLPLSVALARTGQLTRAATTATEGLAHSTDPEEFAGLRGVQLFALVARGETHQARALVDETLALPIDDAVAERLGDLRRHVGLLEGLSPVPTTPFIDVSTDLSRRSAPGLTTEGLRLFLLGHLDAGLQLTLQASARETTDPAGRGPHPTSADIWPPLIELYARGPAAAADLLTGMTRLRTSRGTDWMTAYHEFTRAGIELGFGHLDDAAATWDAGLELAAGADMGWTSLADGGRTMIDVLRGDLAAAATRLDAWTSGDAPDQFGIKVHERVQTLLLESRRKLRPAAAAATANWASLMQRRLFTHATMFSLDFARIGTRAQDLNLVEAVADGLAASGATELPYLRAVAALAGARCDASVGRRELRAVVEVGRESAAVLHTAGDQLVEASAWEETACAAAALGDTEAAREYARAALMLTQGMGAVTASSRIVSRLRPMGVRMDPNTVRDRPTHGWDSLTPTERTVADLVATGASGADVADQLFISPRTVQTHVSHALAKLGLKTRVELAAYVAGRHRD
ncbi:LuxR C-terminal-related transcriptional regulator [Gordonia polyisoprenivorans]